MAERLNPYPPCDYLILGLCSFAIGIWYHNGVGMHVRLDWTWISHYSGIRSNHGLFLVEVDGLIALLDCVDASEPRGYEV